MNILNPVKTIMSTKLITVNPMDKLTSVKEVFETHNIHHIPVVRFRKIVGIISKSDFLHFLRGFRKTEEDRFVDNARLRVYHAEDIMTKNLAKVEPNDRINVALDIFLKNRFHAIPVVQDDELIGIVTTFDVIRKLAGEETTADDLYAGNAEMK